MADQLYLTRKKIFDEAKRRSQLRARSLPEGASKIAIITDSDEDSLRIFLKDGLVELGDKLGELGDLKDYEDTIVHELDETQSEQGWEKAKRLLKRAIVHYLLYEWYRSVGLGELAQEQHALYEQYARKYRTNSTQPGFVKPDWRPYF